MTRVQVLHDQDGSIAAWGFKSNNSTPMQFNLSLGIFEDGEIKGGILYTGYNGSEVEVHYHGPGTLKRHVLKIIMLVALQHFRVNRLVVRTRKESMSRGCAKLGAIYEGKFRRVYGPTNEDIHAAVQWAFFKERMAEIAGIQP